MPGMVGASRRAVPDLGASGFGIPRSKGAMQQLGHRVSEAIVPQYDALGAVARSSMVNDSDATSWRPHGDRPWLWVMAQPLGAYFQSPLPRSPRAFALLIAAWLGLRVREGYSVSQHWQGLGQHCFAPLIRTAKGLAAHRDAGLARCGGRRPGEWQRLGHRGLERPTGGQGRAWYARFRSSDQLMDCSPLARVNPGLSGSLDPML
jgi:Transposase IS66 family